ncbi:MAG: threonine synthase [Deltaproteobacteria bacterium]|jgi:threonine synthase|nr:threonine synthase [Deltaproteobacteria bacterium]
MRLGKIPEDVRKLIIPMPSGEMVYECLGCGAKFPIQRLYYVCPSCKSLMLLKDLKFDRLIRVGANYWHRLFDHRLMVNHQSVRGVFCYHEFIAPEIPEEDIVFLGEAHTPMVQAPDELVKEIGARMYFKLDGLNPTASFKDRGMACALTFAKYLKRVQKLNNLMTVCASTGDTSAAAALYAASLGPEVKSVVLLPKGYVTPQQLSQPLGAGATVIELPGVFDDCMKVVERLSEIYNVVLLNSKNPWRVLGQESYAYEVAQQFDYELRDMVLFVPVGNAGNITAILSGLLKFFRAKVLIRLPRIIAVQSARANPVYKYFLKPLEQRVFKPVEVTPSVAQAAMIGNPVSFPRLNRLAREYVEEMGQDSFGVVEVTEENIMESMVMANRRGLTICTQGGEALAGLRVAKASGLFKAQETAVIDSTAHALKFIDFQNAYFNGTLESEYGIVSKPELTNKLHSLELKGVKVPSLGTEMSQEEKEDFVIAAAEEIGNSLGLSPKD